MKPPDFFSVLVRQHAWHCRYCHPGDQCVDHTIFKYVFENQPESMWSMVNNIRHSRIIISDTECSNNLVHMLNICPIFIVQSVVHRLPAIKQVTNEDIPFFQSGLF